MKNYLLPNVPEENFFLRFYVIFHLCFEIQVKLCSFYHLIKTRGGTVELKNLNAL